MAFRRSFLDQISHFDPGLDYGSATRGGGDLEMFFRVLSEGGGLLYEPKAIVRHCHRRTYAKLRIQIRNWAICYWRIPYSMLPQFPRRACCFFAKRIMVVLDE